MLRYEKQLGALRLMDMNGAALFAEAYPFLKQTVLTWGNFGKLTLPQLLGVNHWLIIPFLILGSLGLFYWFKKGL